MTTTTTITKAVLLGSIFFLSILRVGAAQTTRAAPPKTKPIANARGSVSVSEHELPQLGASPTEVQPVSYLKVTPDVSGFVAVAADPSGLYAVSSVGVHRFDSLG